MRVIQVQWHRPVEKHILVPNHLNGVQRVERTEESEAFINIVVGRQRTSGEVKNNFLFGPIFWNIKVKLPNSVTQISSDGLVKLEREENSIKAKLESHGI